MDPITVIEGEELDALLRALGVTQQVSTVYRVRIHQAGDGSGVKVKINEGTWTYWIGQADE